MGDTASACQIEGGREMEKNRARMAWGPLSRRSFVAGTAAVAGITVIGTGMATASEPSSASKDNAGSTSANDPWAIEELGEPAETIDADLCILGAGGSGTAAAIQATQLGLKVVVLEKKAVIGGSFIGSEGLFAVGSHWQKEAGETFTADEVIISCLDYHHWIPDPEQYEEFFSRTADTVDWLEGLGVKFDHVQALGDSHNCWHVYEGDESQGTGVQFMKSFGEAAEALGIDFEYECSGKRIIMEDGKVAGVLAVRDDGTVVQVNAPTVFVGTGGYANNSDIIKDLNGSNPDRITPSGMNGRDADGLKAMREVGAAFAASPGTMMFYGPIMPGTSYGSEIQAATSMQPHLWVNEDGKRFVNENMFLKNFAYCGNAVYNQKRVVTICNQATIDRYAEEGPDVGVGVYVSVGNPMTQLKEQLADQIADPEYGQYVYQGDTIEELAKAAGLDPDALKATLDDYNAMCDSGEDTQFAKPAEFLNSLADGPYYGFEVYNGYFCTVGGIRVTPMTEVVDENDEVIPGLYAGGCDAGGLYGDTYDVGIAAGSQASWAINSGRLGAKNAAAYLGKDVQI
jgi:fumarate reductase flavoprotein subunit